jgi:hypothetical protein
MVKFPNVFRCRVPDRNRSLTGVLARAFFCLCCCHGGLCGEETNATASVPVSLHAITPVGHVVIQLSPGTTFHIEGREGDVLNISEGVFTGTVPFRETSLWKPSPSPSPVTSLQKSAAPIRKIEPPKGFGEWLLDQPGVLFVLLENRLLNEPIATVLMVLGCLFLPMMLIWGLSGKARNSRRAFRKIQYQLEETRKLSDEYKHQILEMEKRVLDASLQRDETERKLNAALEQEALKLGLLRKDLEGARGQSEKHRNEILELEKRISEILQKNSQTLGEIGSLLEQEREGKREAVTSREEKISALQRGISEKQREIDGLTVEKKELEGSRGHLLEQIRILETKCDSLQKQCGSYEEKLSKSATAPCPHCDQPVKLLLLEKGTNPCPHCGGEIFCE